MFRQLSTIVSALLLAFGGLALAASGESPQAAADAASPPKELALDLGNNVKLELVLIPAGEFQMGSPDASENKDIQDDEKPQHKVRITKPFYLGKYPVTQGQWVAMLGYDYCHFKAWKGPVDNVNCQECQEFLDALSAKFPERGKFQLPTEAQWEYACRAGSTTLFCCGDDPSKVGEYAWYRANATTTQPVGTKKPNAWGLYDMHGNVSEWCADWYDKAYYADSPSDDPTGPATGLTRVVRGGSIHDWGSWHSPEKECRSADRAYQRPGFRFNYIGMRVCLDPVASQSPAATQRVPGKAKKRPIQISVDIGASTKLEMTLIPPGEFWMGASFMDNDRRDEETPQVCARISKPFYLARYTVTQDQWQTLTENNPSEAKGPNNPVESVSWDDCQKVIKKLNRKFGAGLGTFRLPTEAQWEYACRAGSTTRYFFGDNSSELGLYAFYDKFQNHAGYVRPRTSANERRAPAYRRNPRDVPPAGPEAVGLKKYNDWGLYDMHGNVNQWCQDYYDQRYYKTLPSDTTLVDPQGPAQGTFRVTRGGCFADGAEDCRSAYRQGMRPESSSKTLGFRIALDPLD